MTDVIDRRNQAALRKQLRIVWERAIAKTDSMTRDLAVAIELNEQYGSPYSELRNVAIRYEETREAEREAGRAYLAAVQREEGK